MAIRLSAIGEIDEFVADTSSSSASGDVLAVYWLLGDHFSGGSIS
jgi:hypothetical protein